MKCQSSFPWIRATKVIELVRGILNLALALLFQKVALKLPVLFPSEHTKADPLFLLFSKADHLRMSAVAKCLELRQELLNPSNRRGNHEGPGRGGDSG
jgi:hypothetical protein